MKKTLLTLALVAISVGAFAQGKINMVNDATRLVYFTSTLAADAALLNQKAPAVLPSGSVLTIDLYGGATAGSLVLQRSTTINAAIPGGFGPSTYTSALPGGVDAFFQIFVHDATQPTEAAAAAAGLYSGHSAVFTMRPSGSIAFNAINNTGGTALSTWQPGTFALAGGEFGAIPIGIVPEPSSMALAGLGAASLLLFRRRK